MPRGRALQALPRVTSQLLSLRASRSCLRVFMELE
jgi:hypothetical protein